MATLPEVKEKMPEGLEDWGDEKLNALISEGLSAARILNRAWLAKAAKTASFVDISESGSSRSMSSIHANAIKMAEYWGGIADKEEDRLKVGLSRSRTHKARRV